MDYAAGYDFKRALARFDEIIRNDPTMDEAIYATFSAQITLGWTAFETLASDLWEAAHPASLSEDNFKFQSLHGIRKAYKSAFASDTINNLLHHVALLKLSFARNLLVHKSGVVDKKFLNDAASIRWNVHEKLSDEISLDGNRVKELVNPVVLLAMDLILAVDEWLAP